MIVVRCDTASSKIAGDNSQDSQNRCPWTELSRFGLVRADLVVFKSSFTRKAPFRVTVKATIQLYTIDPHFLSITSIPGESDFQLKRSELENDRIQLFLRQIPHQ